MPKTALTPGHCKEVSVKEVDFPLTPREITKNLQGKHFYRLTRYLILHRKDKTAVIEIKEKDERDGLFWPLKKFRIISLPRDTVWVEDPGVDVLNPNALLQKAKNYSEETVVVKGAYEHVSFISGRECPTLKIFDTIPPEPPKLLCLVEKALETAAIPHPLKLEVELTDLGELARKATTPVMYPCSASELPDAHFLDRTEKIDPGKTTLVGCTTSKKIFEEIYQRPPHVFIQMCQREKTAPVPHIAKCCEIRSGYERNGLGVLVPWGATVEEVKEALEDLFKKGESIK